MVNNLATLVKRSVVVHAGQPSAKRARADAGTSDATSGSYSIPSQAIEQNREQAREQEIAPSGNGSLSFGVSPPVIETPAPVNTRMPAQNMTPPANANANAHASPVHISLADKLILLEQRLTSGVSRADLLSDIRGLVGLTSSGNFTTPPSPQPSRVLETSAVAQSPNITEITPVVEEGEVPPPAAAAPPPARPTGMAAPQAPTPTAAAPAAKPAPNFREALLEGETSSQDYWIGLGMQDFYSELPPRTSFTAPRFKAWYIKGRVQAWKAENPAGNTDSMHTALHPDHDAHVHAHTHVHGQQSLTGGVCIAESPVVGGACIAESPVGEPARTPNQAAPTHPSPAAATATAATAPTATAAAAEPAEERQVSVAHAIKTFAHDLKGALKFNMPAMSIFDGTLKSVNGDFGMWLDILYANAEAAKCCIVHTLLAHTKAGSAAQRFVHGAYKKCPALTNSDRREIFNQFKEKYSILDRPKKESAYSRFLTGVVKHSEVTSITEYNVLFDVEVVAAGLEDNPNDTQNQQLLLDVYLKGLKPEFQIECERDPVSMEPYTLLSQVKNRALLYERKSERKTEKGVLGAMHGNHKHKHNKPFKSAFKQSDKSKQHLHTPHTDTSALTNQHGNVQESGWKQPDLEKVAAKLKERLPTDNSKPFPKAVQGERLPYGPAFTKKNFLQLVSGDKDLTSRVNDRFKVTHSKKQCVLCCGSLAKEWDDPNKFARHMISCPCKLWFLPKSATK
jgi:hypothetical protein